MEIDIKFTVTPTADPDVVDIAAGDRLRTWNRREALGGEGPYAEAARTYFDAHPPKPAHPLADAKVGEFWEIDRWRNNGDPFVQCMRTADALRNWQRASMVSARQVYVLPKAEADRHGAPTKWPWSDVLTNHYDGDVNFVEFLSATEVKTWRFGDIVTDDNKPDVPFNIVDSKAVVVDERYDLSKDRGVWRLIWLDGQDLINTVD